MAFGFTYEGIMVTSQLYYNTDIEIVMPVGPHNQLSAGSTIIEEWRWELCSRNYTIYYSTIGKDDEDPRGDGVSVFVSG